MPAKERDTLQEFFDLNDLKAGITHVRDASKVVLRSIAGITDAMLLPFRVFFSIRTSTALKKFENYYDRRQDREREIENELRQLGAYDFNPDTILLNPAMALVAMPVAATKFIFDEAGAGEIPSWIKKAQDELADEQRRTTRAIEDQPGLLGQLSKLFFITAGHDPVGDLISEAAKIASTDREALEVFQAAGIDLQSMQQAFFEETISSLESLRDTVKRREEIFEKMLSAKTADDLLAITKLAKQISPEFDSREVETKIKEFEAGENDDPQAINQAIAGIVKEGSSELKGEIEEVMSKFPDVGDLEKSPHPLASSVVALIEEINDLTQKM